MLYFFLGYLYWTIPLVYLKSLTYIEAGMHHKSDAPEIDRHLSSSLQQVRLGFHRRCWL
jgi:hypothetical protein